MEIELRRDVVDIDRLLPTICDLGITPARLVALGFDARTGNNRRHGTVEIQHLMTRGGESPRGLVTMEVRHQPGLAYLWNVQSRHGRSVVEGDPDLEQVIHTAEFARVHDVLLGLIRGSNGSGLVHGEIFFVGSASRPWAWDASGQGYTTLFGEGCRRAFLRLRRDDILWAEGTRLVAAPADELPHASTTTKTRSVFMARSDITMVSKAHSRMGDRIVVTAGREQSEVNLGPNAVGPRTKVVVGRQAVGTGLFIGHTDQGRGLKALVSLELGTKGGWQLVIFPVGDTSASPIAERQTASQ